MTREGARKAAEVMNAYANGCDIEYTQKWMDRWSKVSDPDILFLWNSFRYRVSKESVHRPFKNSIECLDEMKKHEPFGLVKLGNTMMMVTSFDDDGITINNEFVDYLKCYNSIKFTDGTSFGIK